MLVDLHVHATPPCDPARGIDPASALAEAEKQVAAYLKGVRP